MIMMVVLSTTLNAQITGNFTRKRIVFDKPERMSETTVISENIIDITAEYNFDLTQKNLNVTSPQKVHTISVSGLKPYITKTPPEGYDVCYLRYEYDKTGKFVRETQVFVKNNKILEIQYRCAGKPYKVIYQ